VSKQINNAKIIEQFMEKYPENKEVLVKLREIIKKTELKETIKWGIPTYTIDNKNCIGMGTFKSYVGLWFFQGVFLKDKAKVLLNAQEGKTRGMRQMRFQSVTDIDEVLLLAYISETIENHLKGLRIQPVKKDEKLLIPSILKQEFDKNQNLKTCFELFSKAKKREFVAYLNEPKKEATKINRLTKIIPLILQKMGLNDAYKK